MPYDLHIDSHFADVLFQQESATYYSDEVDCIISELGLDDLDYCDARARGAEELQRRQWDARNAYADYQADKDVDYD